MILPIVPHTIWVVEQPFRLMGMPSGARMTLVRLESRELWVHSPLETDAGLRREIDALGRVRYVVAPCRFHFLGVKPFRAHYPDAPVFGSPGLVKARRDIAFDGVLGDAPEAGWAGDLDQALLGGHRFLDEVVFFHRASGTLIVADLMMSAHRHSGWSWRLFGRATGIFERPGLPVEMRITFRDRQAARASLDRILSWEFDRILLSHGDLIPTGGKAAFRRAYGFLLDR